MPPNENSRLLGRRALQRWALLGLVGPHSRPKHGPNRSRRAFGRRLDLPQGPESGPCWAPLSPIHGQNTATVAAPGFALTAKRVRCIDCNLVIVKEITGSSACPTRLLRPARRALQQLR